jgi:hypothetical protein
MIRRVRGIVASLWRCAAQLAKGGLWSILLTRKAENFEKCEYGIHKCVVGTF